MKMGRGSFGMQVTAKPYRLGRSFRRPVMSAERATLACSPYRHFLFEMVEPRFELAESVSVDVDEC
jgi:hypothetical protein